MIPITAPPDHAMARLSQRLREQAIALQPSPFARQKIKRIIDPNGHSQITYFYWCSEIRQF
jgi:hypothetical protein